MVRKIAYVLVLSLLLMPLTIAGASDVAHVVVVVTPPLSWTDVTSGDMPLTEKLAASSAVALLADHEGDVAGALAKRFDTALAGAGSDVRVLSGNRAQIDAAIEDVRAGLTGGDLLVVVSAAAREDGRSKHLGVAIIEGDLFEPSLLTSASTHRKGLVTADDMIGTAAYAEGLRPVAAEVEMVEGNRTPAERVAHLAEMDVAAAAMERLRVPLYNTYTAAMVVLILGSWFVAERRRSAARFGYWSVVLRRAVLLGLVVPAGATILHVVDRYPESPQRVVGLLLAGSGLVWILGESAWHRWGTSAAIAVAGVATATVLAVDQLLGAPLSFSSIFSYSPVGAFRFFGIGNEGAAILVGAALVGTALELDAVDAPARTRRLTILAVGAFAVVVCAAPVLGANVVVAVWGTVAFGALWLGSEGRRPKAFELVAVIVLVIAALGGAVLLDRFAGGTHIGRAVGDVASGGLGAMLATRLSTSLRIFRDSPLPALVLVIAGGFAYMRWRPRGRAAIVLKRYPVFAAAVMAGLVGGFVGSLVEDSGVVVLALILTYLAGALVMLMLEPDREVSTP